MMQFIRSLVSVFVLALFVVMPSAQGALNAFDRQEFTFENALADKNPGFESGVTQWTASGGTFVSNSGTQIVPNSKQYATWDSNSASQTLQTSAVTVPKTGNCEFSIWIAVPSGTATHTITVTDGSNDLVTAQTITNNTNALKHIVNFPCPAGGTVRGKLTSVNSNEPSISLDNARLGSATTVGSVDVDTPWVAFTPSGSWVSNTTYTGLWRKNGDQYEYQVYLALTGAPTATALTINHLVTGVSQDTAKLLNTSTDGRQTMAECVVRSAGVVYDSTAYYNGNNIAPIVKAAGGTYTTISTNVNATVPGTFANGDSISCKGSVPILGWPSSTVLIPSAQGWFAGANIGAATDINLGTTSVAKNEIDQGDMTLVAHAGSAPVGIVCASGNASPIGGTTCSAGNEVVGLTTIIPVAGVYDVCLGATNYFDDGSAVVNTLALNDFVIDYTSSTSSTAITAGTVVERTAFRTNSSGGAEVIGSGFPIHLCQSFVLPAGQATFRATIASAISGTLSLNNLQPNSGNIRMTVRSATNQTQGLIANSVISRDAVNGQVTTVNTIVSKTTTYTATANDETIQLDASGGAWTLSLPPASSVKGKKYHLRVNGTGTNAITVDPNSTELICGNSTVRMLGLNDAATFQSDGSNWIGIDGACVRRTELYVGTTCTSDPCTVTSSYSLWYTEVDRSTTGSYTVIVPTGVWSNSPTCQVKCSNGAQVFFGEGANAADTTTAVYARCYSSSVTLTDARLSVTCAAAR